MLIFIESLCRFLGGLICGYRGGQVIASRRSYKLLSDNTKGIRASNIVITDGLELNAASRSYRCPIIHLYNLNTCSSNISK